VEPGNGPNEAGATGGKQLLLNKALFLGDADMEGASSPSSSSLHKQEQGYEVMGASMQVPRATPGFCSCCVQLDELYGIALATSLPSIVSDVDADLDGQMVLLKSR